MKPADLHVFDPPMCCSSGVCGPNVDSTLARFSSDLEWLRKQGVKVERYNLSSHPAAFAAQESVKQALTNEGTDCLPLIVIDGSVVHKKDYPTRAELAQMCGIVNDAGQPVEASNVGGAAKPANETAACGPGCACGVPSSGGGIKAVICLAVLVAMVVILAYKAFAGRPPERTDKVTGREPGFAMAVATQNSEREIAPSVQNKGEPNLAAPSVINDTRLGKYLESMSELNKVAMDQDAVFIFIPARKDEGASDTTRTAVLSAQKTLDSKKVKVGLYTLQTASPDYSTISSQVQLPAVLVGCKGRGMGAVSGEVTETKLLQTFMASSRAGGCGPSGCGPSGCR